MVQFCASDSRLSVFQVFCPPNPWTMGIMNVLAELHQEPDLKLNLKFEIEVLCKALNVDINVSDDRSFGRSSCVSCGDGSFSFT